VAACRGACSAAGGFAGGALLADGTVLLLPGTYGDMVDCRIWDPAMDTYTPAPELSSLPAAGQGAYMGGCVLADGRVVFVPWYGRDLVVWEPGLGQRMGGMWRWRRSGIAGREEPTQSHRRDCRNG
jgi:hypothetical protein